MAVLGFDEALGVVRQRATEHGLHVGAGQTRIEQVPLLAAQGRVLAERLVAERDQPPFDRATRDGFAAQTNTLANGDGVEIVGQIRAGEMWGGPDIRAGQAVSIMTGAPLPRGADAVVMLEHVTHDRTRITVQEGRSIKPGENIVARGTEARAGDVLLPPGTPIDAAAIALCASCGRETIEVYARPTVAIVATGDELVELSEHPEAWQIRNSNSYALAALVTAAGGRPGRLPIARDLREEIRERIAQGRMWDLLLFSGGVSMGQYDLVEDVLAEFGAEFFFTGVRMQPGKPAVFGRLPKLENVSAAGPECLFFGLPGNPVSTQVTFHCFVEPLLHVLGGQRWTGPRFVQATLAEEVVVHPGLTRLLPATLLSDRERPEIRLVGWQGSGDLAANSRSNCYAVFPERTEHFAAGSVLTVLLR